MDAASPGYPVKPKSLSGDLRHLPAALDPLVRERCWVVWRWQWVAERGRWTKVPYQAACPGRKASSNRPETWADHATAVTAVENGAADGIGFMLHDGPFAAFDLDECRDAETGRIEPWAGEIVAEAASYTEITVSGTGLRIIGAAAGPHVHRKQPWPGTGGSVETYRKAARYIVVTGLALEGGFAALANIDGIVDRTVERLDAEAARKTKAERDRFDFNTDAQRDLPPELDRLIREGVPVGQRSAQFHHVVGWLKDLNCSVDDIERVLARHPNGIAQKFAGRLRQEIERCYGKTGGHGAGSSKSWNGNEARGSAKPDALPLRWHGEPNPNDERAWLVQDLIPQAGKGLLSGQWGSAKTFAALDLGASVMSCEPFAGRRVVRQGGVLFIAAEGAHEIPIRLRGIAEGKLKTLAEDAHACCAVDPAKLPIAWVEECPSLLGADGVDVLLATANAAASRMHSEFKLPLALVIIDTLAAGAGFQDENAAAENQRVMAALERLSRHTGAFVLGVDHFGKAVETGTRGSSAKEAAADVVLALLADRDISGNVSNTRMAVRKLRGGATGAETPFSLEVVQLGQTTFGDAVTTCVLSWQVAQGAAPRPWRERWPRSLRVFRSSMASALIEHGQKLRPYGIEGPEVTAVAESKVRAEFIAAYPADGETDVKRAEAKRKAFARALTSALSRGLIGSREHAGIDHLWLTDDKDGQDIHTDGQDTS